MLIKTLILYTKSSERKVKKKKKNGDTLDVLESLDRIISTKFRYQWWEIPGARLIHILPLESRHLVTAAFGWKQLPGEFQLQFHEIPLQALYCLVFPCWQYAGDLESRLVLSDTWLGFSSPFLLLSSSSGALWRTASSPTVHLSH